MRINKIVTGNIGEIEFTYNRQKRKVYVYLIETTEGLLLFDSGFNPDYYYGGQLSPMLGKVIKLHTDPEYTLDKFIQGEGYNLRDIRYVICSHLHFDHCGGLKLFAGTDVRFLVQQDELEYMDHIRNNFEYDKNDITNDLIHNFEPIYGDKDLFNNGKIRLLKTPGHTIGHQSLIIEENQKRVILAGDAAYTEKQFFSGKGTGFSYKRNSEIESIQLLKLYIDNNTKLICGHENSFDYEIFF